MMIAPGQVAARTLDYFIGDSFIQVGPNSRPLSKVTYANITALQVKLNQNGLRNRITIPSVSRSTTVLGGMVGDRFEVGDATHSLQSMRGFLRIFGGGGYDTIEFNDTANIASADVTLGWYLDEVPGRFDNIGSRRGLQWTSVASIPVAQNAFARAVTPVTRRMVFSEIENVVYRGGANRNVITLADSYLANTVPQDRVPTSFSIFAGSGNDDTQIHTNTGRITVEGGGGDDFVTIGDPIVGTEFLLGDQIQFRNPTGTLTLAVDSSASTQSRNISLRMSGDRGRIDGFGSSVQFIASELIGLELRSGRGHDRIDIYDTPRNALLRPLRILETRVIAGEGFDEVNVYKTTGPLSVISDSIFDFTSISSNRGLDNHLGAITVNGGRLLVDDSSSRTSRDFTLKENSLIDQRLSSLVFMNLAAFYVQANHKGNRFVIEGAPPMFETPSISTGDGNDQVHVKSLNSPLQIDLGKGFSEGVDFGGPNLSLDAIQSSLSISGAASLGYINIDDSGTTSARDVVIDRREIAWDRRDAYSTLSWLSVVSTAIL